MKLSRPELRALLNETFIGDTDFMAFCADNFPDIVRRRFADTMSRVQKATLLLDYADHEQLTALLITHTGPPSLDPRRVQRIKVLFLAANPTSTKQNDLSREVRQIEERIGVGKARGAVELVARWAVRPGDLRRALDDERPHVLHFSGHGSPREQLLLEDDFGGAYRVEKEALADLIGILKHNLRLVVLNACNTEPHAEALVEHVECAIGMHETIGDDAAIAFSGALYECLGSGQPVATAFALGKNQVKLQRIPEEAQTPRLKVKAGVDPETLVLVSPR
jgi:CHAT domain-containing protein